MNREEMEVRLVAFAVRVSRVAEALPTSYFGQHVARQIVRSGSAAAPQYAEGCAAESRKDFAHKLSVGLKELRETRTWMRIIIKAKLLPQSRLMDLMGEADEICAIFATSIRTARRNDSNENEEQ